MATEKLKVFNNVIDQTSTSSGTDTIPIVNTSATEQAVINNIEYSATDTVYNIDCKVSLDGKVLSNSTSGSGGLASESLTGKQIVDVSSSLDFTIEKSGNFYTLPLRRSLFLNYSSQSSYHQSTESITNEGLTFSDAYQKYAHATTGVASSIPGYSACGWVTSGTRYYARAYSNTLYIMNDVGTTLYAAALVSSTYGITTDGTYIYGLTYNSTNQLQVFNCSDGVRQSNITMSSSFPGQTSNQGAFLLYYNGHLYSKREGSSSTIHKINISTGVVSLISVSVSGGYCAGGLITVNSDGTPYLIHVNGDSSNRAWALNLETESHTTVNCASLNTSTEYGNAAVEIAPGIGCFFYNSQFIWIDVNGDSPTGSNSALSNTSYNFPSLNTNSQATSVANIPIYLDTSGTALASDTTYSLYADGVEITGV